MNHSPAYTVFLPQDEGLSALNGQWIVGYNDPSLYVVLDYWDFDRLVEKSRSSDKVLETAGICGDLRVVDLGSDDEVAIEGPRGDTQKVLRSQQAVPPEVHGQRVVLHPLDAPLDS